MSWRVKDCCCGFSLRTGSKCIGIGNAVYGAVCLVATIALAVKFPYQDPTASSEDDKYVDETAFILENCINCVSIALHIIFNIRLVYGVNKECPRMIRSWVLYTVIFLAVHGFVNVIFATMHFTYGETKQATTCLFYILWNFSLQGYFIIVVRSYLDELDARTNTFSTAKGKLAFQDPEEGTRTPH